MREKSKSVLWTVFACYVLVLVLLLFGRTQHAGHPYNLLPLKTIRDYFTVLGRDDPAGISLRPYAVINFLGNLLAFLPLGLLLPLLFMPQRRFGLFLLTAATAICLVELLQYLSRRGALDIDDLLLNLPGALLGWGCWKLAARKNRKSKDENP
jgi:glycopeptide antibiotics resistance protein